MQAYGTVCDDAAGHKVQVAARTNGHRLARQQAGLHGFIARRFQDVSDFGSEPIALFFVEALIGRGGGDVV